MWFTSQNVEKRDTDINYFSNAIICKQYGPPLYCNSCVLLVLCWYTLFQPPCILVLSNHYSFPYQFYIQYIPNTYINEYMCWCMLTVSEERPYTCEEAECGRSFCRNEELTRHLRIHSGHRPFVCQVSQDMQATAL